MNSVVLDASALIALINAEKGASTVENNLPQAIMSAVNISEVATILTAHAVPMTKIEKTISFLVNDIIPFDQSQAFQATSLRKATKPHGLSFGDRACISLATLKKLPVLTADKAWSKLKLNLKIIQIR